MTEDMERGGILQKKTNDSVTYTYPLYFLISELYLSLRGQ